MTGDADEPILLSEKETEHYRIRLFLSGDGLSCTAKLASGPAPGSGPTADEILELIATAGVTEGIDASAVSNAATADPATFPPEGIDLAHGIPPVVPQDGYIDLQVRPDTGTAEYAVQADGSVDFHNRSDYDLVVEGQEIGVYHPPKQGRPGTTVTGHAIPVPSPAVSNFTFNKGVRIDRESNRINAVTGGRVLFVGNALSVEEEYVVRGDVDLSVGNIRNPGFVVISGDIDDNFSVSGDKGIKVGGVVGASTLSSNGDITVSGVAGKGKGRILCGGNLHARFLNEVDVECRGDVVVETEIRASIVRAGGMILVPNGVVAGGEYIAGRGIEVKTAGSTMGVATALSSGTDYRMLKQLEALKEKLRQLEKAIAKIETAMGPEPPGKKPGKRAALRTEAALVHEEIARTHAENDLSSNAMVNIRGELFENTVITLLHADSRMTESHHGPISIIENTLDGSLRFLPLQPLKKNARDIEAAILAAPHSPANGS